MHEILSAGFDLNKEKPKTQSVEERECKIVYER